ncbi:MAG TPA: PEP-CTERM sorting domain-containing protein [Alphaproteobacteria bacterium]|nr:PEP-CTERM sorting domain-containing protein [Alphaproteobacteria bacterium]
MRTSIAMLVLLLGAVLGPAPAGATTLLSLAGSGDLQLTTTGDLYFATTDLALEQITLFADQQIVAGQTTYTPPASATVSLAYTSLSGTTVLDIDDDVFVTDFVFQGTIDFSAASIFVSGDLSAKNGISLGTANGPSSGCVTSGGIVLLSTTIDCGDTAPVIAPPPPFVPPDGGGVFPSSPVPEPGAALLFGAGVLVVGTRVRRSR